MIELLCVITTLLSVIFTITKNQLCWPIGIIGIIGYTYIFFDKHLYGQTGLQIIFLFQSVYGWYYWSKSGAPIINVINKLSIILGIIITLILWWVFSRYTNNPQPILDLLTSIFSLLANWYLCRKNTFGWYIWIVVDLLMIWLLLTQELYQSAGLYFILLILAYKGLKTWLRDTDTV